MPTNFLQDNMDNKLIETEKNIASKDAVISLLKQQLSKLEESYKKNLIQTEKFRYKFCVTSEQLRRMKITGTVQNQKLLSVTYLSTYNFVSDAGMLKQKHPHRH